MNTRTFFPLPYLLLLTFCAVLSHAQPPGKDEPDEHRIIAVQDTLLLHLGTYDGDYVWYVWWERSFDNVSWQELPGETADTLVYLAQEITRVYFRAKVVFGDCDPFFSDVIFVEVFDYSEVETSQVSDIGATTAMSGGVVTEDGGADDLKRGLVWNTTGDPDIDNDNDTFLEYEGEADVFDAFALEMTGLQPNTTYYVRAYATNEVGTSYGEQKPFETLDGVVSLTTTPATNISPTTATSGGNITADGGSHVNKRGVVWSTSQEPTVENNEGITEDGDGLESFESQLDGLTPGTTYYVRAYAINDVDTYYGMQIDFTTEDGLPLLSTVEVSEITATSALSGGDITFDGGFPVTSRGVVFSTTEHPTIDDNEGFTDDGDGEGEFLSELTNLNPDTQYYVRAYATNDIGTSYGEQETFDTQDGVVSLTTTEPYGITATSATSGGHVSDDGGAEVIERGLAWNTTGDPDIDNDTFAVYEGEAGVFEEFMLEMTGLQPNTTYYVRAYATNEIGTSYGEQWSFDTLDGVVSLTTTEPHGITATSAISGSHVSDDGGAEVTERGLVWNTTGDPDIDDYEQKVIDDEAGLGEFTIEMTGLAQGTTYYVQAYAKNEIGGQEYYHYGGVKTFTTLDIPQITTTEVTNITHNSAESGGNVTHDGNTEVTAYGVVWSSTNEHPGIDEGAHDGLTQDGSGTGTFSSLVTDLNGETTYYLRAYATNSIGTGYGDTHTFETAVLLPEVVTGAVSEVSGNTALGSGEVTFDGGSASTVRGLVWGTEEDPTLDHSEGHTEAEGSGEGLFSADITGLTGNTDYYVRAYATNSAGTVYGDNESFTTLPTPGVVTDEVTGITINSAVSGGDVTSSGGMIITQKGVCWSTQEHPTVDSSDGCTDEGGGTAAFVSELTGLEEGTQYFVRAYATNANGTGYGQQHVFHTHTLPEVITAAVEDVGHDTAMGGGEVTFDGYTEVTARGLVWSTHQGPDLDNHEGMSSEGAGTGTFTSTLSNLEPNTTYYFRAYATNDAGTAYGEQESFTTLITYASVLTDYVVPTSATEADVHYEVIHDGGSEVTARGVCWSVNPNPTIDDDHTADGSGLGSFTSSISGLTAGETYYVRAYAINDHGISYGENLEFVSGTPALTTKPVIDIAVTTAQSGGIILGDGGSNIIEKGVVWSTSENPTIENNDGMTNDSGSNGDFTSNIEDLEPLTQYYLRAYATNAVGTSYGDQLSFRTYYGMVTDIDGNDYYTVMIGYQEWMAENLRVSRYNNGDDIPTGLSNAEWGSTTSGAFAIYNNDNDMLQAYGKLYNWYAVNDARGLCPEGWSVPSDADWTALINYVVSEGFPNSNVTNGAGNALKSCRQVDTPLGGECNTSIHPRWHPHSTHYGFDEFGFSALPGGLRWSTGSFGNLGALGYWWSLTKHAWSRYMFRSYGNVSSFSSNKTYGLSLRCVRVHGLPSVSTLPVGEITASAALGGGVVTDEGAADVSARGLVWSTQQEPDLHNHEGMSSEGAGTGTYTSTLSNLEPNTKYYVRAYATNDAGTGYGDQENFTTLITYASVLTDHVIPTSATEADVHYEVVHDGGSEVSARGVCWSVNANPTIDDNHTADGSGLGSFTSSISGLMAGETYYVRAYAINDHGISYGEHVEFVSGTPVVNTKPVIDIAVTTAQSGGIILGDGGNNIIEKGVVWSTSENPTTENNDGVTNDGGGDDDFISNIEDLEPSTQYYLRAYATNTMGTSYGDQRSFRTYYGMVTDIDGNDYYTVMIGYQEWMAENLRVTRYNNEDDIPTGLSNADWGSTTTGAYAIYNNDDDILQAYGKLYNWYAVVDSRGLCPEGWSVPSDADWTALINYVVSEGFPNSNVTNGAGNALKSCRQVDTPLGGECNTSIHPRWHPHSTHYGFDEFGFSALPGGYRGTDGSFSHLGALGYWWSSTEYSSTHAWCRAMGHFIGNVFRYGTNKTLGFSLRCVRVID